MKKTTLLSAAVLAYCILQTTCSFSQGTAINTNGNAADSSAILDVSSTSQGLLIPRMTEFNRVNIPTPATGLMVYQTDVMAGFYYFNGTSWTYIGADNLGNHTATDSLNMSMNKIVNLATCTYNYDAANKLYVDNKVGAGGGGGSGPTSGATELSMPSANNYFFLEAAAYCDTLTEGGHSDWYMPTSDEIITLAVLSPSAIDLYNTNNAYFWTSTLSGSSDGMIVWQWGNSGEWIWSQYSGTAMARCARK